MARVDLPQGDDDELLRLYALSPAMGGAAGNFTAAVYGDTSLPTRVREAARIRIAELNQCPVCLDTRTTSDPDGLTEEEYLSIADWRSVGTFSPRERIAVEFADGTTLRAGVLVNCAGLQSDRVAARSPAAGAGLGHALREGTVVRPFRTLSSRRTFP